MLNKGVNEVAYKSSGSASRLFPCKWLLKTFSKRSIRQHLLSTQTLTSKVNDVNMIWSTLFFSRSIVLPQSMENLSLHDAQVSGGPNNVHPSAPPQLPPQVRSLGSPDWPSLQELTAQMFTTAAQLLDLTDSETYPSSSSLAKYMRYILSWMADPWDWAWVFCREVVACFTRW